MLPIAQAVSRLAPDDEPSIDVAPAFGGHGQGLLPLVVTQAMAAIGVGDYAGALALIRPHETLARETLAGCHAFGLVHMNVGAYDSALRWFDGALLHQPNYAPALLGRAALLHTAGASGPALETLTVLLRAAPDHVEALTLCGAVLSGLRRSGDALRVYDEALRHQPRHAPALAGRGILLDEQGASEAALADLEAARQLTPGNAALHAYSGRLLQRLGRVPAALAAFEAAIRNGGTASELFCAQGLLLQRLGRPAEALVAFDAGLARNPGCGALHCNRGNALHAGGDLLGALAAFETALRLEPSLPEAALNRATLLLLSGDPAAAASACEDLAADAVCASAYAAEIACLHGAALSKDGRPAEALPFLEAALDLRPDYAEALLNRANALQELGHLPAAVTAYEAALARRPDYPEALSGLGVALKEIGRLDEAARAFDRALALRPDFADARNNRAGLRLLRGDFMGGLADYESRWLRSNAAPRASTSSVPAWRGEPVAGRRVLVYDEQGFGDLFQFCRYLPLLVAAGALVTVLCRPSLRATIARLSRDLRIVDETPPDAAFDLQCALMSLPYAFGTRLDTVPASGAYIVADEDRVTAWAERLGGIGRRRIGLCWHGSPGKNLERNVPLQRFAPLAALPDVHLVSLMKDIGPADAATCTELGIERPAEPFEAGDEAFADTAAILCHLDLVVTTDTAIAHLAGALGRPTFLLLKHVPDWRWLLDRADSPWYPTMRLFRQEERGTWDAPLAALVTAVAQFGRRAATTLAIPAAVGELVDKITILELKAASAPDGLARDNVLHELAALRALRGEAGCDAPAVAAVERQLKQVNAALWDIEDAIRREEARAEFGSRFVELARAVYVTNDRRAALKRRINDLCGSTIVEEKFYAAM